jgi:UDP-2,3-diacylglucosamine hydrolase
VSSLFVSDLHLDDARPGMVEAFVAFCAGPAREARALYILGDLFEAWIGDDDDSPLAARVAKALRQVADAGVDVAFQHGNRDFLLGEAYAARCGMRLLPEHVVERIEGIDTLLLHGDTLCLHDTAYARFRAQVRDPAWQAGFLSQPLAARRAFAAGARAESARHTAGTSPVLMDVDPAAVAALFSTNPRAPRMIHGHTHRPAIHTATVGGVVVERIVLADWYASSRWMRAEAQDLDWREATT